ncbi:sulfatase-like hydrolase/transferase [Seonamhaeicola marinus]|uniref:Sulfatase-like hydrolase/transferase n=1 Tax=Seonamhaeicola marinus TaxID=1912246 RepID=A0A5D0J709_9FLAO|nr:sulfatase-like hydrolase/transferase [Seonamhaeicola marinus]TYA92145.1 sulfatase-like hydrolase/transferase [Seonamhaeicola marinus]
MRKNYLNIVVLITFVLSGLSVNSQTAGSRPNVIVILADDLGYGDVGFNRDAYNSTHPFPAERGIIPTPNIDALANNGVICRNAHVAHPFCGPSRVGLLTGIMPHRIGAQYNLPNDNTTTLGVPTEETYFTNILQDEDYNTAAIGKWHLGHENGSYQPLDRGFDYFFGMLGGGKNYFESIYEDAYYNRLGGSNPVTNEYQDPLWRNRGYVAENEFSDTGEEDYLTDVLTDEAISYIAANAPSSDPFFLYLSYNAPHTPLQAPAAEIAQFKVDNPNFESLVNNSDYIKNSNPVTKLPVAEQQAQIDELTDARVTYATMVANMDKNIGRVVAELQKDMTEFNNTVIIFLSDNGGYTFSKGAVNWPLDALKGSVKEGGHKVPMFVHWPAQISSSSIYDHQLSSLDLYPTLVNLAGGTIPVDKTLDGVDFMDDLIAGTDARPDESVIIMRPQNGFHNGGLSNGKWKIVKTASGAWKLYDIIADPGETTDVRSTEPNAEQIIQDMLDDGIATVVNFKDVKPLWYDNDGDGSGHPHSFLWNDGTLPAYNALFESSQLLLESEISQISIEGVEDAVEGETNGVFTVSLPEGVLAPEDITITYAVSGEATNGVDFTTLSGSVTILNGENNATIDIAASSDGLDETSETLTITLQTTTYGTIDTNPVSIFIYDAIAPTVLTAGDIAIVGFKAEGTNNGAIAFMLLKDISATTKLSISNRSWKGTQDGWTGDYSVDDIWTWTSGDAYNTGDIFKLDSDGLVKRIVGNAEVVAGTTSHDHTGKDAEPSDGDFDMATGGDGILIFQIDPFALPTDPNSSVWITGLNTNGGWGTGGGNTFCALPTALTNGVNANAVGTDQDNGVYTGALNGTSEQLRTSINNSANWITSETTNYNLWPYSETSGSVAGQIGSSGTLSNTDVLSSEFRIYPNPTSNTIHLTFKNSVEKIELELLSITGRSIKSYSFNNTDRLELNTADLTQGTYILKVLADDNLSVKRILKK